MSRFVLVSLIAVFLATPFLSFAQREKTEAERKARVEQFDKKHLRYATGMATDTSREYLRVPDRYKGATDFDVAKTPPTVDFAPTRGLNPEFFPEDNKGLWSQWGKSRAGRTGGTTWPRETTAARTDRSSSPSTTR
ncbi:MAG: hypothetical protein ACYC9O_08095 [Candidatus Latescibacterota bacterium]